MDENRVAAACAPCYWFGRHEPVRIYLVYGDLHVGMTTDELDVTLGQIEGINGIKRGADDTSDICDGFKVRSGKIRHTGPRNCPPDADVWVLLMGPGSCHNDFEVRRDEDGHVDSIGDVRHWD